MARIAGLRQLERDGIIRELCPVSVGEDYGRTAYWRFYVVAPDKLPKEYQEEYRRLRELRWYSEEE